jgi:hypothetical protein
MKLLIEVLRGKKIRSVAWLTPAPFCVVSYGGDVFKTKVAKEVLDELTWNENFTADFSSGVPELTVEIWQRGFGVGDSLIAKGSVRLSELCDSRWDRRWCETFYRHRGEELSAGLIEVHLRLFETQALLDEYRESARLNDASDVAATNVAEQGLSTRHWIPDTKSNECFWPACRVVFGPFNRRHHCRMCGLIFCSSHAASKRRIDRTALPCHDGPFLVRVCDGCAQIGASTSASEEIDRLRDEFVKVHFATLNHARVDGPTLATPSVVPSVVPSLVPSGRWTDTSTLERLQFVDQCRTFAPTDQLLSPTAQGWRPPMPPVPTADAALLAPPRFMPVPPIAPPPPIPVQQASLPHYPPHQNNAHAATAIAGGSTFFGGNAPHAHAPAEAWRGCWDAQSGRAYFWNTVSGEVSWSHPSGGDGALVGPTAAVLGDRRPIADLYPMQPPSAGLRACARDHAAAQPDQPCEADGPMHARPPAGGVYIESIGAPGSVGSSVAAEAAAKADGFMLRQTPHRAAARGEDRPQLMRSTALDASGAQLSPISPADMEEASAVSGLGVARSSSASSTALDDDFYRQLTQIHDRWLTLAVDAEPVDPAHSTSAAHDRSIADGLADGNRISASWKLCSCVNAGDAQGVTEWLNCGADPNFVSSADNHDRCYIHKQSRQSNLIAFSAVHTGWHSVRLLVSLPPPSTSVVLA